LFWRKIFFDSKIGEDGLVEFENSDDESLEERALPPTAIRQQQHSDSDEESVENTPEPLHRYLSAVVRPQASTPILRNRTATVLNIMKQEDQNADEEAQEAIARPSKPSLQRQNVRAELQQGRKFSPRQTAPSEDEDSLDDGEIETAVGDKKVEVDLSPPRAQRASRRGAQPPICQATRTTRARSRLQDGDAVPDGPLFSSWRTPKGKRIADTDASRLADFVSSVADACGPASVVSSTDTLLHLSLCPINITPAFLSRLERATAVPFVINTNPHHFTLAKQLAGIKTTERFHSILTRRAIQALVVWSRGECLVVENSNTTELYSGPLTPENKPACQLRTWRRLADPQRTTLMDIIISDQKIITLMRSSRLGQ
jgi:hypothetical protein